GQGANDGTAVDNQVFVLPSAHTENAIEPLHHGPRVQVSGGERPIVRRVRFAGRQQQAAVLTVTEAAAILARHAGRFVEALVAVGVVYRSENEASSAAIAARFQHGPNSQVQGRLWASRPGEWLSLPGRRIRRRPCCRLVRRSGNSA